MRITMQVWLACAVALIIGGCGGLTRTVTVTRSSQSRTASMPASAPPKPSSLCLSGSGVVEPAPANESICVPDSTTNYEDCVAAAKSGAMGPANVDTFVWRKGRCENVGRPVAAWWPLSCPSSELPQSGVCVPKSEIPVSQGGTYHPGATTQTGSTSRPPVCPGGSRFADGECAPPISNPSACPSSQAYNAGDCTQGETTETTDPCPSGYVQIPPPTAVCLGKGATVVGNTEDNSVECPAGEDAEPGSPIGPASGPIYTPYSCVSSAISCPAGADGSSGMCLPDSVSSYADCVAAAKGQYESSEGKSFYSVWQDGTCTSNTVLVFAPWWTG